MDVEPNGLPIRDFLIVCKAKNGYMGSVLLSHTCTSSPGLSLCKSGFFGCQPIMGTLQLILYEKSRESPVPGGRSLR